MNEEILTYVTANEIGVRYVTNIIIAANKSKYYQSMDIQSLNLGQVRPIFRHWLIFDKPLSTSVIRKPFDCFTCDP